MREAMSGEAQPRIEIQVPEGGPPNVIETPEEAARDYATLREQDRLIRAMHGSSGEFALRTLDDYAGKNGPEAQRRAQLDTLAVADARRILATATPFFADGHDADDPEFDRQEAADVTPSTRRPA